MWVAEQVNDNGESYWVFESRDVSHVSRLVLLLAECSSSSPRDPLILSILGGYLMTHLDVAW
jgi:hypothetical protein